MTWHADAATLDAYAGQRLDAVRAASLEAHLAACGACRSGVAACVDPARLDRVFAELVDALDAPARSPVERALARLGVSGHSAHLVASTPALSVSWLLATAVSLAFAVAAAHTAGRGMWAFLVLAPLLPVLGVASAYGPRIDPLHELARSTPTDTVRLVLLRAAAILTVSLGLAAVGATLSPASGWLAAAWLLPALALTLLSLGLGTLMRPALAAGGVLLGWIVGTGTAYARRMEVEVAFGGHLQWLAAMVLVASVVLVVVRRDALDGEPGR